MKDNKKDQNTSKTNDKTSADLKATEEKLDQVIDRLKKMAKKSAKLAATAAVNSSTPQPITAQAIKPQAKEKPATPKLNLPEPLLTLPVIPVREGVLFPSTESILTFGREISKKALLNAAHNKNYVVLVTQKRANLKNPQPNDLYQVGTLAIIERSIKNEDTISALVRGISRVKILNFVQLAPMMMAQVVKIKEILTRDDELMALSSHLQKLFREIVQLGKPVEFLSFMKLMSGVNEGELADQIASTLDLKTAQRQQLLETFEVKTRIKKVIEQLTHEMKVLEIEKDVVHKTQKKFDQSMRESILRERLKTIQKELGEIDETQALSLDYRKKLKKLHLETKLHQQIDKEITRLEQMSVNNPESGYIRAWLDTVFDLPWGIKDQTNIELKKAEKILEKNHYGLKDVKDRILEYIAVLQLSTLQKKQAAKAPTILCFVGPPGVGKTSIGKSIAQSLGRKFTKISLGGIRDEAEIRGHRRTYVGAMAGRIINGIKQAGSLNPVFMLDEVDKIGQDFRGDPAAALLEVLDPEQNQNFEDHYLDFPFDLSQVIFITTANTLDTIPPALRDRLEIIAYSGYTFEEKFQIAQKHLLDKVLEKNSLQKTQISLTDEALNMIIQRYTREAGVRDLERQLGKIARKVARKLVENKKTSPQTYQIEPKLVKKFLGPEIFDVTLAETADQIGLANGLAWTSMGGDMLFIEVALTPGKGQIKLTGQLGNVMKESAQTALTYIKAHAQDLAIKPSLFEKNDVHIHVPEGAVPKDGPSAGITMTTAIASAFSQKKIRRDLAMTGEVTLRGRVLRIGGLKEKSIAAHRSGIKTIIIPADNQRDLVELPKSVKQAINFVPVKDVADVLKLALKN